MPSYVPRATLWPVHTRPLGSPNLPHLPLALPIICSHGCVAETGRRTGRGAHFQRANGTELVMVVLVPDVASEARQMISGEIASSLRNYEVLAYTQFLSITREVFLLFSRIYLHDILPNHPAIWHLPLPSSGS